MGEIDRRAVRRRRGCRVSAYYFSLPVCILLGLAADPSFARDDLIEVKVETAREYQGRRSILEMPFFLRGESIPATAETVETMRTTKTTQAFSRSDSHACSIAFQSAIIQLQERAFSLGANAVVDIVSIVDGKVVASADSFRCHAGNLIARVSLRGTAAKLPE